MEEITNDFLAQQDLRVLLDNAPDAIGRFDRRLRHVYVNGATARANGRPAADFYGKTMEDLGHAAEVCELINSGLRTVFATGREHTVELLFHGPDGPVAYQSRMAPEFSADRQVEFVLVMSRDISELKRAEAQARAARNTAALAQISARLAHEIHNPLTAAVNALYLLQSSSHLQASDRVWVDLASEQLERLSLISKKLLKFSNCDGQLPDVRSDAVGSAQGTLLTSASKRETEISPSKS